MQFVIRKGDWARPSMRGKTFWLSWKYTPSHSMAAYIFTYLGHLQLCLPGCIKFIWVDFTKARAHTEAKQCKWKGPFLIMKIHKSIWIHFWHIRDAHQSIMMHLLGQGKILLEASRRWQERWQELWWNLHCWKHSGDQENRSYMDSLWYFFKVYFYYFNFAYMWICECECKCPKTPEALDPSGGRVRGCC